MANNRFISSALPVRQEASCSPILAYESSPVLTLEKAVEELVPLYPGIMGYVATAKEKHNYNPSLLTDDESAAIYLYTMSKKSLFSDLNIALRGENQRVLKPWFAYLKLFTMAISKLPSKKAHIWRGVNYDATSNFVDNDIYTWWGVSSCSMNIHIVQPFLGESGTLFAIESICGKDISMFSAIPDEQEVILMPGTRVRAKSQSVNLTDRLFIIDLEEINLQSKTQCESNYLYEQIKQEYQRNSRIERFMNPSMSFPIEQSYINLAIVTMKEQRDKEKQLGTAQDAIAIMGTYEEIYGIKTAVDIQDIFKTCKGDKKQVLVFGRAGIGKSTFSRYIAYQWAKGSYWSQYELVALISLRRLTAHRYPPEKGCSLLELVKTEVYLSDLSKEEDELLEKQFDPNKTLWILDGYDETEQNAPPHLERLFKQLLNTAHHIVTSRPYLNTLSYDVQMEITGFTDNNIEEYVQRFFDQMKDKLDDASIKSQKLLSFLRSNPSVWGVAHIPVNLELICSVWSNEDWSDTEQLTITALYTMMTEWLCRRYLTAQSVPIKRMPKGQIHQRCQKELTFLETLAFHAMQSNTVLIRPVLLEKAFDEAKTSFDNRSQILNIGFLKSVNQQGTGTQIETEKDHYFVHLSLQEYFTARYLVNVLSTSHATTAVDFIKQQKYNQRYISVFAFTAGLVTQSNENPCLDLFWNTLLGEPLDLVGIRHLQLVISCLEETTSKSNFPQRSQLLKWIGSCIRYSFILDSKHIRQHLIQSLRTTQAIKCDQSIINVVIGLLEDDAWKGKTEVLSFVSNLNILNPCMQLVTTITNSLNDENEEVRQYTCILLSRMGEKAVTKEVITKLVSALRDKSGQVRYTACTTLGQMGEKAATNEVITKLLSALVDNNGLVRDAACTALGKMGEKAATNEVITKLFSALADESEWVRDAACTALGKMGEKAAANEVIAKLMNALDDESDMVRVNTCETLERVCEIAAKSEVITKLVSAPADDNKSVRNAACTILGKMDKKTATNEVITKLLSALADKRSRVRDAACTTLGKMGEKAATNEVITKLVSALADDNEWVRDAACTALGKMGEEAAANEVIAKLMNALDDESDMVRVNTCETLERMCEIAASSEVITKLVSALADDNKSVRNAACTILGKMGKKTATNEVITKLVSALADDNEWVRDAACTTLGKMGEKAATNEVITKLVSALADDNERVRDAACTALGQMGEKAATPEVIIKLMSTLEDESDMIRADACEVLEKMGWKAARSEVITKLVSTLVDKSEWVRGRVCIALGKMGEQAATNEVITKLVSALADENGDVRDAVCRVLGQMGEKAATNEVIAKLVITLADERSRVRCAACRVLGKMGEIAATTEVITKLGSALADGDKGVRVAVCKALGKMGKIAATNEVIAQLASALADGSYEVRYAACTTLGKMGEIAATNEVIAKLAIALADESRDVRDVVCRVLGNMGQKAATNEVIAKLVSVIKSQREWTGIEYVETLQNILCSFAAIKQVNPEVIAQLCSDNSVYYCLKNVLEIDLINIFSETGNPIWLNAIIRLAFERRSAVILTEEKVWFSDKGEPVELRIPSRQRRQRLFDAFIDQRNRFGLRFYPTS